MTTSRRATDLDKRLGHLIYEHLHTLHWHNKNMTPATRDLATSIGLSYQQVRKYLQGHDRIPATTLYKIEQHFNLRPGNFFDALSQAPQQPLKLQLNNTKDATL